MEQQKQAPWYPAVFFAIGSAAIIVWALAFMDHFAAMTKAHPFAMGFVKLFFLGTMGELLKLWLVKKTLRLGQSLERAIVWGIFGLWFTLAFPAFSFAAAGLVNAGLWPGELPTDPTSPPVVIDAGFATFLNGLWLAFSKSLWINLFGMYALGMMVGHEYCNHLIASRWRSWSLNAFASGANPGFVLGFLPKTLFFWIPAHTFTFSMPGEWRVFIAALLAIVLGFLLSVGRRS